MARKAGTATAWPVDGAGGPEGVDAGGLAARPTDSDADLQRAPPGIDYLIQVIQDLRRQNQRYRTALEALPLVGVAYSDPALKDEPLVYANPGLATLSGYAPEEILGRDETLFYGPETDYQALSAIEQAKSDRSRVTVELQCYRKDGSKYMTELTVAPVLDETGALQAFAYLHRDSSERHALRRLETERRREQLQGPHANFQFMANLIHEFRTPLNAIIGFADVLQNEIFGELPHPKCREYVGDIMDSGGYLLDLVNEILDLAKADVGRLELAESPIDVAHSIRASVRMIEPRSRAAAVQLSTALHPDLPRLYADERRVRQILINLLANAVKFTPSGGEILLTADRDEGGGLLISVLDTGIGMTEDDLPIAVAPFGQIGGARHEPWEGTGLGLPLTRKLLEIHGGCLEILSSSGQGTMMIARFPANRVVG